MPPFLWGCAPFLFLVPCYQPVRTQQFLLPPSSDYLDGCIRRPSHSHPTSWCPVAQLLTQFGAMSQPSRPATPGPSVTGIVVTLAVLRRYYVIPWILLCAPQSQRSSASVLWRSSVSFVRVHMPQLLASSIISVLLALPRKVAAVGFRSRSDSAKRGTTP